LDKGVRYTKEEFDGKQNTKLLARNIDFIHSPHHYPSWKHRWSYPCIN